MHATQAPVGSQTVPLLSLQTVPTGAETVPQQPPTHVSLRHDVACAAQSLGSTHAIAPPQPPPLLLVVAPDELLADVVLELLVVALDELLADVLLELLVVALDELLADVVLELLVDAPQSHGSHEPFAPHAWPPWHPAGPMHARVSPDVQIVPPPAPALPLSDALHAERIPRTSPTAPELIAARMMITFLKKTAKIEP